MNKISSWAVLTSTTDNTLDTTQNNYVSTMSYITSVSNPELRVEKKANGYILRSKILEIHLTENELIDLILQSERALV